MANINLLESYTTPCYYSQRLIDKASLANEISKAQIDITQVEQAIYYAKKYHGDQTRLSGELYYTHPLSVAYNICSYLPTTEILVTSILHDTLEDTTLTFEEIAAIFGIQVANNVQDLTRIKLNKKISVACNLEALWREKKRDLLLVKLFDRMHNMESISFKPTHKIQKTLKETVEYFTAVSAYFGIKEVEEKFSSLCQNAIKEHSYLQERALVSPQGLTNDQLLSLVFQNDEHRKYIA